MVNDTQFCHKMMRFGQENHTIHTYELTKNSLCSYNDKLFISRTGPNWIYHSFGYKDITQLNNLDFILDELDDVSDVSDESEDEEANYCSK